MKIMTYNVQTGTPTPTRAANMRNNILDYDADIIDFCFVSRNDFEVNKYEMTAKEGSDHYPVYLDMELKN